MPSNLRIVRLRDYIEFDPQGNLAMAKIKEAIRELAASPGVFSDYDVLVDTRGAESHLSVNDNWEIAEDLANVVHARPPKGYTAKIAVICPTERFNHAKFLALCSQNRGLNVKAFTAFEELFDWLSEPPAPVKDMTS